MKKLFFKIWAFGAIFVVWINNVLAAPENLKTIPQVYKPSLAPDIPAAQYNETAVSLFFQFLAGNILFFAGAIAVLMLVWAGAMYVTAMGDEGQMGKAKNTIKWTIGALIAMMLSYAVLQFVLRFFLDLPSGNQQTQSAITPDGTVPTGSTDGAGGTGKNGTGSSNTNPSNELGNDSPPVPGGSGSSNPSNELGGSNPPAPSSGSGSSNPSNEVGGSNPPSPGSSNSSSSGINQFNNTVSSGVDETYAKTVGTDESYDRPKGDNSDGTGPKVDLGAAGAPDGTTTSNGSTGSSSSSSGVDYSKDKIDPEAAKKLDDLANQLLNGR